MKKKHNQTYFKSSDILNINNELPIKIKKLQKIINNVSKKYPTLSKEEIALISKALMEELREQLLQGNSITLREFIHGMRLYTFCRIINNKITFNTRVQVNTPPKMNKKDVK